MIKAFGLEDRQSALFAADAADTGAKNMRVARIDARFDPTIYIAIGMANLLAIGGGSWMVVQGADPGPADQLCDVSGADDLADAGAGLDV
jgi:ATP-binding cassette subfamily B multidrug efflux pump